MSLWLYGPKRGTRRPLYLVGTHPGAIILAVIVMMMLVAAAVQWVRSVIR